MRNKKGEQEEMALGTGEASKRLTPVDIQEKVFKASFRGYDEREVDAFLDEVTEEFARLHAEIKRLRERGDAGYVPAPAPSAFAGAVATAAGDDQLRELTSGFIARERTFLQELAGLVQQHAEAMKGDVRRARAVMEAPAAPIDPAPGAIEPPPGSGPQAGLDRGAVIDLTAAEAVQTPAPAPVTAAPVTAAPAATGTSSQDEESLREMFWGEE
ncbi:MAG TPA: DivIVA domain-containing protein [Actinomycetota bacterium]|jgi:DivIVA domain-containing protein